MWNLTVSLCLIWAATILYGEMFAFWLPYYYYSSSSSSSCSWPRPTTAPQSNNNGLGASSDDNYVNVAVLADPQLMDKTSLPLPPKSLAMGIAQFYTDLFMRRAFLASVLPFKPHLLLFLGDYFDGAPSLSHQEWQESLSRFRHTFDLDRLDRNENLQVYYIPGNHDIGYSALHSHLPHVFRRYEKVFGTRNFRFKVGEVDFIAVDAQTVDGHPQGNLTSATWNFIKNISRDSSSAPRVLLTHIPLYRVDGTSCGVHRSSKIINQRVSLYGQNQEIMYQNYVTEEKTKNILDSIRPAFILSGHDHDQCTVTHMSKYGPVTEQTLGTISWQQGNLYPSFMLLSARNFTISNASSGEDSILTNLCFLPVQTYIYLWYICQFVLTLLAVLVWPTSGLHFSRHVGNIKSRICCNFFKGVAKEKNDEENCEFEMMWDAEGSMHLIKRTTNVTATPSDEKGNIEKGNAVMRSAAKKQILQEKDVSMPLDVNIHVGLKLPPRTSKSKTRMVIQRVVRSLRVITVVAAVNLPIYMMLLFKDWIDK